MYLFQWENDTYWKLAQTILPSNLTGPAYFGTSVVLDENTLAIGAPGYSPDAYYLGGMFIIYYRDQINDFVTVFRFYIYEKRLSLYI